MDGGDGAKVPRLCIITSIHPDYDARVFRHACAVAENGWEVDLVCPWTPDGTIPIPENLRLITFKRVGSRILRPFLIPKRILSRLRRTRYDLYHIHDIDILPLFVAVKLMARRPVIYDCHENYSQEMLYRAYIPRYVRWPLALGVAVMQGLCASVLGEVVLVVPSQEEAFPKRWVHTTLVRNYAELSLAQGRRRDYRTRKEVCISIASQYVDNGALFVLDIAEEVSRRRPGVEFHVADRFGSDIQLRARVLSEIAKRHLEATVRLVPNVPPPQIMTNLNSARIGLALDAAVRHRINALPIKLFEYMAAGLPIVASDLPNTRAVIARARCGLLVPPGDATAFANAISRLLDDEDLALEMGEAGAKAFRNEYNFEAETQKLLSLYRELMNQSR
jgi:glycosyltransferase involved in cell wall biosynthesis